MGRALLALTAALVWAPSAPAGAPAAVVAVPGASLEDLRGLGAVGLVVPDAGPTTSQARAVRSLERGRVVNSLRSERLGGAPLVSVSVVTAGGLRDRARPPGTLFVGVPEGGTQRNDRRYAIARAGAPRGLLTSTSTRIPGLVAIADVARGELAVEPRGDAARYLRALDARIDDNARTRRRGTTPLGLAIGALALVAPLAALLAFVAFLLVNLSLGVAAVSEPAVTIPALVASVLAALPLARAARRLGPGRRQLAVGVACTGVIAVYLLAMAVDATSVALAPFGATQNSRFYGLSNTIETALVAPVLAGAYVLGRRLGWAAFALVAVLALVTVSGSRFGADGGGALVLAAGFAVLAAGVAGGGRRALGLGMGIALLAVAAIALDALVGPATHVGEAVRGGPGQLAHDVVERLRVSWRRATDTGQLAATVGGSIAVLSVLVLRGPRRPLPLAVAAAIAVSLLVNDSPKEVAGGGLVAYLAVSRLERREPGWAGAHGYTFRIPLRRRTAR